MLSSYIQVLLVFPKEDRYFRLLSAALTKLGFKYESAKNVEEANMKFHNNQHHLIIVDFRHGSNADSESFCRYVYGYNQTWFTNFVVVIFLWFFWKHTFFSFAYCALYEHCGFVFLFLFIKGLQLHFKYNVLLIHLNFLLSY